MPAIFGKVLVNVRLLTPDPAFRLVCVEINVLTPLACLDIVVMLLLLVGNAIGEMLLEAIKLLFSISVIALIASPSSVLRSSIRLVSIGENFSSG